MVSRNQLMSFPKCAPLWSTRFAAFFRQFIIQRSCLYPLLLTSQGTAPVRGAVWEMSNSSVRAHLLNV